MASVEAKCRDLFLSRAKDLFKFTFYGEIDFDREDPINRGVIADQLATNASSQVTFRYIKYRCPNTGLEYEFVTNHMKIRPEGPRMAV